MKEEKVSQLLQEAEEWIADGAPHQDYRAVPVDLLERLTTALSDATERARCWHGELEAIRSQRDKLAAALRESRDAYEQLYLDLNEAVTHVSEQRDGLRAERDALRAALQPFAAVVMGTVHYGFDDNRVFGSHDKHTVTWGDLRRARVLARVGTP